MTPTDKLRRAIDRREDALAMGTPDVMRTSMSDLKAELAKIDAELAEARQRCPDCGSPMPGDMCSVCALAHAEAELVELRKELTGKDQEIDRLKTYINARWGKEAWAAEDV